MASGELGEFFSAASPWRSVYVFAADDAVEGGGIGESAVGSVAI